MRILLINPPIKNIITSEVPSVVNREVGVLPPLGLMYIASCLKKYSEYEVKILDAIAEAIDYQAIQTYIREYSPDLIGITAHTHNLVDVIEVAKRAKEVSSRIHISLGGAHARVFPRESIEISFIDSVIAGEGEFAFLELAKALEQKAKLQKVKGLFFKDEGSIIYTQPGKENVNLDSLPFPDRKIVNPHKYYYILGGKIRLTTMLSSRGCPYKCTFCSTPFSECRVRSYGNVVDEMEECKNLGLDEIHFVDDTFNIFPERVISICDEIRRRKLRIRWSFRGRVDTINREMLAKLKRSGCVRIHLGVETSSDINLKRIKKGINIEQVRKVFGWTRRSGIKTVAYFMIGFPYERNKQNILDTIDFAVQIDPDYALFNVLALYPYTEVYKEALERKILKGDPWRDFVCLPRKDFAIPVWEEHLRREELFFLLNLAYRKFYLRPKFLLRTLFSLRSCKGLFKKLKAGIKIYKLSS